MMYPEEVDDFHMEELRKSKRTLQKQRYLKKAAAPIIDESSSSYTTSHHDIEMIDYQRPSKTKKA